MMITIKKEKIHFGSGPGISLPLFILYKMHLINKRKSYIYTLKDTFLLLHVLQSQVQKLRDNCQMSQFLEAHNWTNHKDGKVQIHKSTNGNM